MATTHVGALLPDVNVVQGPLVLHCGIALTPAEAGGAGPRNEVGNISWTVGFPTKIAAF